MYNGWMPLPVLTDGHRGLFVGEEPVSRTEMKNKLGPEVRSLCPAVNETIVMTSLRILAGQGIQLRWYENDTL